MQRIRPMEVQGCLQAPPSKSLSQRAALAAMLAHGQSTLFNYSFCDDGMVALGLAQALGASIERSQNTIFITGNSEIQSRVLNCGESGFCLRSIIPIVAQLGGNFELQRKESLRRRPLGVSDAELTKLGISIQGEDPLFLSGMLKATRLELDCSQTSQFLSGLLFALPVCEGDSEIRVQKLVSRDYISLTLQTLSTFGVSWEFQEDYSTFFTKGCQSFAASPFDIEGDWSGASFFLVAGAIAGSIEIEKLAPTSLQADKAIMNALELAGAKVEIKQSSVKVERSSLRGFVFDATACPDLFPALVVLGCNAEGVTQIGGVKRLLYKESNRAKALLEEFSKLGAKIEINDDVIEIRGSKLKGGQVQSHGDHRIAMACAIAGLGAQEDVMMDTPECVSKSYPDFFRQLEKLSNTTVP